MLSIALAQIQLRPKYGPSYDEDSDIPRNPRGHPVSPLRDMRIAEFTRICKEFGQLTVDSILDYYHETHKHINRDDARKILDFMVDEKKLNKVIRLHAKRNRAFYFVEG